MNYDQPTPGDAVAVAEELRRIADQLDQRTPRTLLFHCYSVSKPQLDDDNEPLGYVQERRSAMVAIQWTEDA